MAQLSLFLVVLLALVIPIFMARFKISTVPTAIAEIIVGIIVGSSGFNIVVSTHDLTFLSNLGVILLMFLSGMEINFDLLQRKNNPKAKSQAGKTVDPLPTALTAFAGIVVMAFVLAYILKLIGLFSNVILAANDYCLGCSYRYLERKGYSRSADWTDNFVNRSFGRSNPIALINNLCLSQWRECRTIMVDYFAICSSDYSFAAIQTTIFMV